jgi:uncharacterized protein YbaR (Trm112 family)
MLKTIKELEQEFLNGKNISQLMREERNIDFNTPEIIEVCYELQTGEYQKKWANPELNDFYEDFTKEIANTILDFHIPESILEAGIGEATTFVKVLKHLNIKNLDAFGFDISWSRTFFAKKLIEKEKISNVNLCTGNLLDIPFLESSIDLVYTYHSIEPNRGNEENILKELYRVTKKYLILFEPDYENTTEENRSRMDSLGYVRGLEDIAKKLNYKVVYRSKFKNNLNERNPTAIIVIKKDNNINQNISYFACPVHKTELIKDEKENLYFGIDSKLVYPIIKGIPCLRKENTILATKYEL